MNKHRGFTLVELLVVVAIIGVLVAVAIPVFSAQQKKTRAAVCAANRRSLKGELAAAYMSGDADKVKELTDQYCLNSTNTSDKLYTCPDGGTIIATLTSVGTAAVDCTAHTGMGSSVVTQTLKEAFMKVDRDLDSGASVSGNYAPEVIAALEGSNMTFADLKIQSWSYRMESGNNIPDADKEGYGRAFYYTSEDIQDASKYQSGSTVYAIKYNFSGKYEGLYSVWSMTVGIKTLNGTTYNTLDKTTGNALLSGTKDYAEALKKLQELTSAT